MAELNSGEQSTFDYDTTDNGTIVMQSFESEKNTRVSKSSFAFKFFIFACLLTAPSVLYSVLCKRPYDLSDDVSRVPSYMLSACLESTRVLFLVGAAVGSVIFLDLVFDFIKMLRSSKKSVKSLDYILALRFYVLFCMLGIAAGVTSSVLFKYDSATREISLLLTFPWQHFVVSISWFIFVCSVLLLVEKSLVLFISVRFHKMHYRDRLEENNFCFASMNFLKEQFVFDEAASIKLFSKIATSERKSFDDSIDLIFDGLKPQSREHLILQDFQPYFTPQDAEKLFDHFDKDGNGDLTRAEFQLGCKFIKNERSILSNAILESDQTVKKLDRLLLGVVAIILVILFFVVFQIDINSYLASFGTIFISLTFVFGNPMAEIFESIVFVFVTHPFDIGDKIVIDGESCTVQEIGFLTTTLLNESRVLYYPTFSLKGCEIQNIRRSPNQFEELNLFICHESEAKMKSLQEKLIEFVKTYSRDYGSVVSVYGFDIVSPEAMKITVYFEYKTNFQDGKLRRNRRNRFVLYLRSLLVELNIKLAPQPSCHS